MKTFFMLLAVVFGLLAILMIMSLPSFFKDMQEARDKQESFRSKIIETASGSIEYAIQGEGEPILAIHGVTGGYDQALQATLPFIDGYKIIAPSRFGYQHSSLPKDASPEAQADAFALLLDSLGISQVTILGMSAGGPSTIQFALRHPDRVKAMILLVPLAYTFEEINDMQRVSTAFLVSTALRSDYLLWLTTKLNRKTILRTMGIPVEIQKTLTVEEQYEYIDWLFPLRSRVKGIMNDGKVATNLQPVPLYDISSPTLIITAQDDPWRTYPGSLYTARRIKGAELLVFDRGGHLFNGKEEEVKKALDDFLQKVYTNKKEPSIVQ